jgi:hypothetical protein
MRRRRRSWKRTRRWDEREGWRKEDIGSNRAYVACKQTLEYNLETIVVRIRRTLPPRKTNDTVRIIMATPAGKYMFLPSSHVAHSSCHP